MDKPEMTDKKGMVSEDSVNGVLSSLERLKASVQSNEPAIEERPVASAGALRKALIGDLSPTNIERMRTMIKLPKTADSQPVEATPSEEAVIELGGFEVATETTSENSDPENETIPPSADNSADDLTVSLTDDFLTSEMHGPAIILFDPDIEKAKSETLEEKFNVILALTSKESDSKPVAAADMTFPSLVFEKDPAPSTASGVTPSNIADLGVDILNQLGRGNEPVRRNNDETAEAFLKRGEALCGQGLVRPAFIDGELAFEITDKGNTERLTAIDVVIDTAMAEITTMQQRIEEQAANVNRLKALRHGMAG